MAEVTDSDKHSSLRSGIYYGNKKLYYTGPCDEGDLPISKCYIEFLHLVFAQVTNFVQKQVSLMEQNLPE
jgi:hypothetical protein